MERRETDSFLDTGISINYWFIRRELLYFSLLYDCKNSRPRFRAGWKVWVTELRETDSFLYSFIMDAAKGAKSCSTVPRLTPVAG
jgi:hypothetical protein